MVVEYFQGWLANPEDEASKQAIWRFDPKLLYGRHRCTRC
jgi:hypothetical protein